MPAAVTDTQMSAQLLLRRSRLWLGLTLLALLSLVLALAAWQAHTQWRRVLDAASAELRTQSHAFEVIARDADHHVADMRYWMQQELLRPREDLAPGIAQAVQPRLRADGQADGHSLDALPQLLRGGMAQLLWPQGNGRPPPAVLQRAQALSAVIELAHQRNPDFAWSYFFGWPERHVLLFPWVPSAMTEEQGAADMSSGVQAWYGYEVVTAGLPESNPARQSYWTAPYVDAGGQGLLVSHAAPLYLGDDMKGIVGTDIKLGTLEGLLARLPGAPWRAWVVDPRGHLLADRQQPVAVAGAAAPVASASASASASAGMAELLPQRLPAGIDRVAIREAAMAAGRALAVQDQALIAIDIAGAPWTLVLAAPRRELLLDVLPQVLPFSLIALCLLLVFGLGQGLLRRRILTPVLMLLAYLQRLSADPATAEPRLGPRWQPWVGIVTRTFAQMRSAAQREQRAEALKSAIVDHAQAAVVVADEAGRVVEFNPAAEAMLGWQRERALGRSMRELLTPERFFARFDTGMRRMRDGDPDRLMGRRLLRTARRADGSELPVEVVMWLTRVDGTAYFTASITDLTATRAAADVIERQRDALRQSEKLTAMGSLLAGVAHELNNPLAIVMGRASLLEEKTEGTPLQADAARIRDAAERCGRIVRTFLNMARSRPAQRGPVQLNDLVRGAADMLGYTLRSHGIEVELQLQEGLPEVQADGDQIGQVVLNLIVNAQQALAAGGAASASGGSGGHGGHGEIGGHGGSESSDNSGNGNGSGGGRLEALGRPQAAPRRITVASGRSEAGVWLTVADNGPGIAAALREQVFEPFFTTKAEGMGTGLGLSVSRSIVRDHGGQLGLDERRAGQGACFRLQLPLQAPAPALPDPARPAPAAAPAGGRVLVVDDEPEIAEVLRGMLEAAGFDVATADSGALALEMLATAPMDAIVSDLRMPDMDGAALWRAVRERHPALARRMLFVTGDTLSAGSRQFLDETGCPRLDKPFNRADLLARLAPLLHPRTVDA